MHRDICTKCSLQLFRKRKATGVGKQLSCLVSVREPIKILARNTEQLVKKNKLSLRTLVWKPEVYS